MQKVDYRGVPGEFRSVQNWIGNRYIDQARFVPPPPDYLQTAMNDLATFLQSTPKEEDPFEVPIVIRMAIAHAQFETIHPFTDGNGRVGRILLPLMLAAEGYPPVYIAGFLKQHQKTYYDMLAGVQLQDRWTEWVQFFATAVEESAKETIATASALMVLLGRWSELVSGLKLRSDSAAYRLPELLIGSPVVTARQVEKALGVSFPAANNALSKLVEAGVLTPHEQNQRNRRFVAPDVIEILNRLPGENGLSREDGGYL
jgi:Fic family protein